MKTLFRLLLLGIACAVPTVSVAASAAPTGELIDRVWAGHPVGFALLTERGHQFMAYYDAERRITVLGRKLDSTSWTRIQPPGVPLPARKRTSNVIGWDSHNYLRLALDRDGCVHLSGNMHGDALVYYRTREPFDVSTLERIDRMTGEREARCTYPVFFKNAQGDLLFRYRDGSSGNGSDFYNIYDPKTKTWRRQLEQPLLDGEGQRNGYAIEPVLGPDGRFHVIWMWRDTPDCATNHTLSYARSADFKQWETSRGEPLTLPIRFATGEVVDAAKPGEGLINMTFNLGFDAQKKPVVVYHRYDAKGRSQVYAARPAASGSWESRPLSTWDFRWQFSGNGSIPADVRVGPPRRGADGALWVDFSTDAAGAGRWKLDADTLAVLEQAPPTPPALPEALRKPTTAGMEVQNVVSRGQARRWVLRWETLPKNRDRPRDAAPPPSELRLYELPDAESSTAKHVGS